MLHQLGGSIRVIARRFWHAADGEAEGIVAGTMWEQIRAYDWRNRTERHASVLHHETRKAVRAILLRDPSRWQSRAVIPLSPQSWVFEFFTHLDVPDDGALASLGAEDELEALLRWSVRRGILEHCEVALLNELIEADRDNRRITKWMRGVCSVPAVEKAAAKRGISAKTVVRTRDRVIAKLREAAPVFLNEVA